MTIVYTQKDRWTRFDVIEHMVTIKVIIKIILKVMENLLTVVLNLKPLLSLAFKEKSSKDGE